MGFARPWDRGLGKGARSVPCPPNVTRGQRQESLPTHRDQASANLTRDVKIAESRNRPGPWAPWHSTGRAADIASAFAAHALRRTRRSIRPASRKARRRAGPGVRMVLFFLYFPANYVSGNFSQNMSGNRLGIDSGNI